MLFNLQIFSGGVHPPSTTSRTSSFFFYFQCFDPLSRSHLTEAKRRRRILRRMGTVSKSATFLATESVTQLHLRGEKLRCKFLARKSAKLIANFSATNVTSLPSVSVSLSLTSRTSRTLYRKRFCASYNIVIENYVSQVLSVALTLSC